MPWNDFDALNYSSSEAFTGSISFSYTETWYYYWVPEYAGDEPTSRSYPLEGTTTMEFGVTSSSQASAGAASASITLFGVTYSAAGSSTPNDPDPPTVQASGSTGAAIPRTGSITLSGEEGTFSLIYSGNASTDEGNVMTVHFAFQRTSPQGGGPPRIRILRPVNQEFLPRGEPFTLMGNWWHGSPVAEGATGVLLRLDTHDGMGFQRRKQASVTGFPSGRGGKWTTADTIAGAGACAYEAWLQKKNQNGELEELAPNYPNNPDTRSIVVY